MVFTMSTTVLPRRGITTKHTAKITPSTMRKLSSRQTGRRSFFTMGLLPSLRNSLFHSRSSGFSSRFRMKARIKPIRMGERMLRMALRMRSSRSKWFTSHHTAMTAAAISRMFRMVFLFSSKAVSPNFHMIFPETSIPYIPSKKREGFVNVTGPAPRRTGCW